LYAYTKAGTPSLGIQKLQVFDLQFEVVMDGIEPPTQGFSVLCSTN
jgi:hypothetical protein